MVDLENPLPKNKATMDQVPAKLPFILFWISVGLEILACILMFCWIYWWFGLISIFLPIGVIVCLLIMKKVKVKLLMLWAVPMAFFGIAGFIWFLITVCDYVPEGVAGASAAGLFFFFVSGVIAVVAAFLGYKK